MKNTKRLLFTTIIALFLCAMGLVSSEAQADIVFNELDFAGDGSIELVNNGTGNIDITNWWFCNRVNGSPFYQQVNAAATSSSGSFDIASGEIVVLSFMSGTNFAPSTGGELGLYTTNSFGSSAAIHDYMVWDLTGIRDSVAEAAGIWTDGEFIDTSSRPASHSIQLSPNTTANGAGHVGDGPEDFFFATPSLGFANVPEPTGGIFLCLAATLGMIKRKRS